MSDRWFHIHHFYHRFAFWQDSVERSKSVLLLEHLLLTPMEMIDQAAA